MYYCYLQTLTNTVSSRKKNPQIQKSITHYYSMDVNFEDNYKVFTVLKVRTGVPSTGR